MKSLIFVYNANSGFINLSLDIAHKIISPKTYQCNLCTLTHDTFKQKSLWKQFMANTNLHITFYHKDEFKKNYPTASFKLPCVIENDNLILKEVIDSKTINNFSNLKQFINALNQL